MLDKVITALIKVGKPESFFRIKMEWLLPDEIPQFEFIRGYVITHQELPTYDVMNRRFHKAYPVAGAGRLGYEIGALRERYVYLTIVEKLPMFAKDLKKEPVKTLEKIRKMVSDLETYDEGTDLFLNDKATKRFEDYLKKVGTGGVTYLSLGHDVLDKLFHGLQKTDLVTIGGRGGLGKTWLLVILFLLIEFILPEEMGPLLLFSNEIGTDEMGERFDCKRFLLDYSRFLDGKLPRDQRNRYRKGLEELEKKPSRIIIIPGVYTLDGIVSKIMLYKPCMFGIDGSYLISGEGTSGWEKISFITRGLKRICLTQGIPGINTTQLTKGSGIKKAKSSFEAQDEFAFASSFVQDSDIALAGYQTPQMRYYNEIGFNIAKGRRVKPGTTLIWEHVLETMNDDFRLESDDDDEDDEPTTGTPGGTPKKRIIYDDKDVEIIV